MNIKGECDTFRWEIIKMCKGDYIFAVFYNMMNKWSGYTVKAEDFKEEFDQLMYRSSVGFNGIRPTRKLED